MPSTTNTYEIATSPTELVRILTDLLNAGDVDGLMTMYEKDATFSPEFGVLATGADEIRAALTAMTSNPLTAQTNVTWVQQVGDHALVVNDYTMQVTSPDGTATEIKGRSTDVVHRGDDGGWRYLIDCLWAGTVS